MVIIHKTVILQHCLSSLDPMKNEPMLKISKLKPPLIESDDLLGSDRNSNDFEEFSEDD